MKFISFAIILLGLIILLVENLFKKDIHSLEKNDLNTLIGVPESRSIEFKTIHDIDPNMNHSDRKKRQNMIKKTY